VSLRSCHKIKEITLAGHGAMVVDVCTCHFAMCKGRGASMKTKRQIVLDKSFFAGGLHNFIL